MRLDHSLRLRVQAPGGSPRRFASGSSSGRGRIGSLPRHPLAGKEPPRAVSGFVVGENCWKYLPSLVEIGRYWRTFAPAPTIRIQGSSGEGCPSHPTAHQFGVEPYGTSPVSAGTPPGRPAAVRPPSVGRSAGRGGATRVWILLVRMIERGRDSLRESVSEVIQSFGRSTLPRQRTP
jgi:hypothetical protein